MIYNEKHVAIYYNEFNDDIMEAHYIPFDNTMILSFEEEHINRSLSDAKMFILFNGYELIGYL